MNISANVSLLREPENVRYIPPSSFYRKIRLTPRATTPRNSPRTYAQFLGERAKTKKNVEKERTRRERTERHEGGDSGKTPLMRSKVEQTVARTRYFKASFTGKIDLIEGMARNEDRMRSTSRWRRASRFYACLPCILEDTSSTRLSFRR